MRYLDLIRRLALPLHKQYEPAEAMAIARRVIEALYGIGLDDWLQEAPARKLRLRAGASDLDVLDNILQQLLQGVPVQYVLGHSYFMGHRFSVGPGVLIPRPETEELTQYVLDRQKDAAPGWEALDLCTGSGCIAISLALEGACVVGVDCSAEALRYARRNRQTLGQTQGKKQGKKQGGRVRFFCRDIFKQRVPAAQQGGYAIVVSNPPYVQPHEVLSDHVRLHEPSLALYAEDLAVWYGCLVQQAQQHLAPKGWLYVETHHKATELVRGIFLAAGFDSVVVQADLFGRLRFVWGQLS